MVTFAGCAALTPGDSETETPAGSAETTAPETSTANDSGPPGVSSDGAIDPFAAADAHADALDGSSYAFGKRIEIRYANGTVYTDATTNASVAANGSRYLYDLSVQTRGGGFFGTVGESIRYYSNGSAVLRKVVRTNGTNVSVYGDGDPVPLSRLPFDSPRNDERIAVLYERLSNVSVTQSDSGDYRLRSDSFDGDSLDAGGVTLGNVTNAEFEATVAPSGLVRSYDLTLRGTLDGERVTMSERVRYIGVGNVTVARPPWSDGAAASE
jgi:hypothetical protein